MSTFTVTRHDYLAQYVGEIIARTFPTVAKPDGSIEVVTCRQCGPNVWHSTYEMVRSRRTPSGFMPICKQHHRARQRALERARSRRSDEEIAADRARLHPDGLKRCAPRRGCGRRLPFDAFYVKRLTADGLDLLCKECVKALPRTRRLRKVIFQAVSDGYLAPVVLDTCHLCQGQLDWSTPGAIHVDHIIPISRGGTDSWTNLRFAHAACNLEKSDSFTLMEVA